jgi:hypothetical protein
MMFVIAKECQPSVRLQKFAVLDGRIPLSHPVRPKFESEYKSWLAGYKGEKSVMFYLSLLPEEKYQIFHDLRLKLGKYYLQIDFLLLCSSFGLVLEVKNRKGMYHFNRETNETILRVNESEERIKNPVQQARMQARKLKIWLKKHNCPDVPIYYLFVNSNERATFKIEAGSEHILATLCHAESLLEKINVIENYPNKEILDAKDFKKVKRLLISNHTPDNPNLLDYLQLSPNEIPTGVQCPKCHYFPMVYSNGKWLCPNCETQSKTAYIQAIHDCFLLYGPSITSAELRKFLHVNSPRCMIRIIHSMDLDHKGTYRNRVYFLK